MPIAKTGDYRENGAASSSLCNKRLSVIQIHTHSPLAAMAAFITVAACILCCWCPHVDPPIVTSFAPSEFRRGAGRAPGTSIAFPVYTL
jgi:hypothetical protein